MTSENTERHPIRTTCCPCGCGEGHSAGGISRRGFLQGVSGAAAVGTALSGLTWSAVSAAESGDRAGPQRRALVVRPILTYDIPEAAPANELAVLGRHPESAAGRGGTGPDPEGTQRTQEAGGFPHRSSSSPSAFATPRNWRRSTDLGQADVSHRLRGGRRHGPLRRHRQAEQEHDHLLPAQVRAGLPLVRDHQSPLPAAAHRRSEGPGHRRGRRDRGQPGRDPLAAAGPVRPAEHAGHEDPVHRRTCRLGSARGRRAEPRPRRVEIRYADGLLRRSGQADQRGPCRRGRGEPGEGAGRRLPQGQGRQAGDQARVRRKRVPAGAGLHRPDEEGRLPGDHDQRLHGYDHAAGGDLRLSDAHAPERLASTWRSASRISS